ncbi:MAG: hypothetical protein UT50_C0021G0010 [Candidatus Moranbacteria bacterium GW2011_GWA2_39_41]|nr:MAG: hypothetical protein UT50_C0021G0010 [Candidatus Moranbacteria bacterium GW2011_GWA2_39_41]
MLKKETEKQLAIQLRQQGLTYAEIMSKVNIAKSTLSVWLKDVGIAKPQTQKLTLRRKLAQIKASETCRNIRIEKEKDIIELAKQEIGNISKKELKLIGAILYWAEGSKQKKHNVSQRVSFGNYDPKMVLLFDRWLREICCLDTKDLVYCIYIHKTADKEKARLFWEKLLKVRIEKIYFKTHNPKTNRKNVDDDYNGLLRIDVSRSTDLNRKINGWIQGIIENLKI